MTTDPEEKRELSKVAPDVYRSMTAEVETMHASVMRGREIRAKEIAARVGRRVSR